MARMTTEDGKPVRVFAHYVLGRLFFLFFLCHPGTLATCDGQAYLLNRYPNRDLVTAEGQMQDHRRHFTPRDPADFTMKTGVPEDFLHGNVDNWTPDWAVSLEQRFHRTVKAWLRGPTCAKQQAEAAVAKAAPPGFAFVPTVEIRASINMRITRANGQQNRHWISLAELQTRPCCNSRPSALMRRSRVHGHRCPGNSHQMLLGLGKRGFRFRRSIFSAPSAPNAGGNSEDNGEGEGDRKCDARASVLGATDVSIRAKEMLEANSRTLEDHEPPKGAHGGLLSSLFGSASDVYDSAISFVGCVLVTSPLGKRYLNAFDSHISVPTSTTHRGEIDSSSSGDGSEMNLNGSGSYEFVGFHNIDPFEASGRRGKRLPNYLLRY